MAEGAEVLLDYDISQPTEHRDERGCLVELLKGDELSGEKKILGQIYFVTFEKLRVIRGNHYHIKKEEWFIVAQGRLHVELQDVDTRERVSLVLDSKKDGYVRLRIGKKIAHAFMNLSPTATMVNYASQSYHQTDPDTFPYVLIKR